MNALEKFLAMIGMSSDRYAKLSEAEQTQIQGVADGVEAAESARIEAESALTTANESITALTGQLSEASETISAHSDTISAHEATIAAHVATIEAHTATITAHEATIAELRAELDKVPGAADTTVVKKGAENLPGEKQRKKRSWETD